MELSALCPVVRLQFRSKFCHVRARKAHSDGQISRLTLSPFLSISLSPFKLPSSDHFAAAASSFSKERLALLHESIFLDSDSEILNEQSTTFVFLEENIDRLEEVLNEIEEEIVRGDIYPSAVVEAESKVFSLQKELSQLQTLLESKHNRLEASLDEIRALKSRLQDVEVQSGALTLYKEAQEAKQADELSRLQSLSKGNLEVLEKHMFVNEAMNQSLEMVQNVWECITRSNSSLVALKLIGILQREALHYFEALGIALKELEQEKIAANKILLKLQKSSDNLKEKDMEINSLRHEVSRQIQKHEVLSKELANAGAEVSNLNKKLSGAENLLEKERKSLSAARDGLEKLDHALLNEESKVRDLFREVSSLKVVNIQWYFS